ncbi:hypothetical protein [Acidimangrovimonas pyrenivorans]|uniref:Uncharacterized protein n=1 Tax=Acidimangrovimonas pyrenivorans TaxID=2030798 RepID=A0ABV7AJB2_9RHOB
MIGRYRRGPFQINLAKSGFSFSAPSKHGTLNLTKPQYSSFRMFGLHIRGRRAARLMLLYLGARLAWMALSIILMAAIWLINLALQVMWLVLLPLISVLDRRANEVQTAPETDDGAA